MDRPSESLENLDSHNERLHFSTAEESEDDDDRSENGEDEFDPLLDDDSHDGEDQCGRLSGSQVGFDLLYIGSLKVGNCLKTRLASQLKAVCSLIQRLSSNLQD